MSSDLSHANNSLHAEIASLRASAARIQSDLTTLPSKEWSIALRRASDKYDHLEATLKARLIDLQYANAARQKAIVERDETLLLLRRMRAQYEDVLQLKRNLELSLIQVREEKAMMDLAMSEYADLVRSLTASVPTSPMSGPISPSNTLTQGLSGLSRLFIRTRSYQG